MATEQDWIFLRDVLRTLDAKVERGEVVSGPPWNLPSERTGDMARDYLEAARRRFDEVEAAVKRAALSPMERVKDAGRDVGARLREGAKRAAAIAREVAKDMAESFEKTVEKMEESGKSLAFGIGAGGVLIIIVGLLLLRELK
jgi:hypothetical protein